MSPDEVLAKHSSLQLNEWAAFFTLEDMDQRQAQDKAKAQSQVARARRGKR